MQSVREKRAKLNIFFSLLGHFITLICGLIVPRLMLGTYGSEAYGATASITQFLAYITLLEGGIGGVARAALYKPLADNNIKSISTVVNEIKAFFRVIAVIFVAYVLALAFSFKELAHVECFDWISTFLLVIVISISTFAQYFIGISYSVLLQAAQRTYITQITSSLATILNTICIVILVFVNSNLIVVKLVSSIVFAFKPFVLWLYVRKEFKLENNKQRDKFALEQKWTGLGQHIAFFLHSNTDIAVLTVLSNLTYVSVYSVYNMVVSQIQNFTSAFSTGMESIFGDMLAKNEMDELNKTFDVYESIISLIAGILFSITAVMIVPFVRIYTSGIEDVNYIFPSFAILLVVASFLYCLRMPYHSMTIAAGHFKQTKFAAYGEAIINISLSIILVIKFNLIGVAIGTVCAVGFRFIYYVIYLSQNIFYRPIKIFLKRFFCNAGAFALIITIGYFIVRKFTITNYLQWALCSAIIGVLSLVIETSILIVFYRNTVRSVFNKILKR